MLPQIQVNALSVKDKNLCMNCRGMVFMFAVDVEGILKVDICDRYREQDGLHEFPYVNIFAEKKKIEIINLQKLNLVKIHQDDVMRRLYNFSLSPQLRGVLEIFTKEWPQIKKDMAHQAILENPDGKQIVRPISDSDVTNINIFNRNAIFLILGKHERARLTEKDENGDMRDILKYRTIKSWNEGFKIIVQGPVICDNDKLIFDACLKLHHENGFIGLTLKTSYSAIWRTLGNKSKLSQRNIDSIKRSLIRLSTVRIQIKSEIKERKNDFWSGGVIETAKSETNLNSKFSKIIIQFNSNLVKVYLSGSYTTLNMNTLLQLRSYARRMFEFLVTHKNSQKTISLARWKEIVGIEESVPLYTFKQRIKEALAELKKNGAVTEKSGFNLNNRGEDMVFTDLVRNTYDIAILKETPCIEETPSFIEDASSKKISKQDSSNPDLFF